MALVFIKSIIMLGDHRVHRGLTRTHLPLYWGDGNRSFFKSIKWKTTPTPTGSIFGVGPSVGVWPSVGVGCMAMFAAFPSTGMEAAFGRLHKNGKSANIAMQPTTTGGHTRTEGPMPKMLPEGVGLPSHFLTRTGLWLRGIIP